MLFADRIKKLREKKRMVQRQFAASLEINTPMYRNIERRVHRVKHKNVFIVAKLSQINRDKLVVHWFVDNIVASIGTEPELVPQALKIALKKINRN